MSTILLAGASTRPISRKALSQSFRKALRAAFSSRICIAVCAAAQKKSEHCACGSDFFAYLCSAFHLNKATESPLPEPAAFFMPLRPRHIKFRPVWSVNAPTALFKVECNGERNFSYIRTRRVLSIITFH